MMLRQAIAFGRRLLIAECIFAFLLLIGMFTVETWWGSGHGSPGGGAFCRIGMDPKSISLESRCDSRLFCDSDWDYWSKRLGVYVGVYPIDLDEPPTAITERQIEIEVPTWLVLTALSILPVVSARVPALRLVRLMRKRCRGCNYDVRMHTAGLCPECGLIVHSVRSLWRARFWPIAIAWSLSFMVALVISSLAIWWIFSKCGIIQPDRDTSASFNEPEKEERPIPPTDRILEPTGNCALTESWPSVLFPDLPIEKIDFTSVHDRYLKDAARLDCGQRYPSISVGQCNDGSIIFLKRSEGYGARTLYFDADKQKLIGAAAISDVRDAECAGIYVWRDEIVCRDYEITAVICGTSQKVGTKGKLAMPLLPRSSSPKE